MRTLIAAAVALGIMAAPATAQQLVTPPPLPGGGLNGQPAATIVAEPVAMMIATCDADGDGQVTRAELVPCVARSFAAIDTDHKGSIGYIDYSDWALRWLGDRNALPSPFTVDADGDNRITLAELQAQFDTLFARFDADKDGAVTRAELLTIKSAGVGGFGHVEPGRGKRQQQ
jgi:Ca2+-binding EF-hand superfamily protein